MVQCRMLLGEWRNLLVKGFEKQIPQLKFNCLMLQKSVKELNSLLEKSKFELLNEGIRIKWNPDEAAKKECFEFGKEIGLKLVEK
ncbi:MAG: hypothetical protein ACTSXK_06370 [Promethearchaeota archaeon]